VKSGDIDRTSSVSSAVAIGLVVVGCFVACSTLLACATPRTTCPLGTQLGRRIYSGGGEVEWCGRDDGVRQGPETRYYENGRELTSGGYLDGAQSGIWRYRFNDGRNWRAERWEDGTLIQQTIDPAVARMSPAELEALGPTTSGIIKLASRDPRTALGVGDLGMQPFASYFDSGRPRTAGQYDADGLRSGTWHFWFEDGRPAREIDYRAGVRDGPVRQWYPAGGPAAEGRFLAGVREGLWRFWDPTGRPRIDVLYKDGVPAGGAAGGMLPRGP
jgi:MORN repeat variant